MRGRIDAALAGGRPTVVACSALRAAHRRALGIGRPGVELVLLMAPAELLARRLRRRRGHFFPAELLPSQLDTLEIPDSCPVLQASRRPAALVAEILRLVGRPGRGEGEGAGGTLTRGKDRKAMREDRRLPDSRDSLGALD
jgi:gluconate kinase